jgi:N6-adenosine-specific RNA methylase IME4
MIWIFIVIGLVMISFVSVLFVGAPYVPTLSPQVITALGLANLKKGQTMLELGCGDGKVLITAAEQGLNVVGYELNPILAFIAWLRTRKYGSQVKVIWGNYWHLQWPPAEAIFVFLLPKYMPKLHKKCVRYSFRPIKLVSFAFPIPNKEPDKQKDNVYLYSYK